MMSAREQDQQASGHVAPRMCWGKPAHNMVRSGLRALLARLVILALLFVCLLPQAASAREGRLALLVGNEHGWKKDPKLKFALSGDLLPVERALRKVGFEVKSLQNQKPGDLRKAFAWVQQRLARKPRVHTFVFYYTGHADKRFFHMGPKGKRPFGYQEFIAFFKGVKAERRIAILDSCYSGSLIRQFGSLRRYKGLLAEGVAKGVRARHRINLQKWVVPRQGHEQGLRLISSSLDISWELRRYRASVFTHFFLQGLKGTADLNQDGKISIDELFDYASREVTQATGQRPQQLILLKRSAPYALAPAYNSHLWIGPKVKGQLKVTVGNFAWQQTKKAGQAIRLSVVKGVGLVSLQRGGRCWWQQIQLKKRRELRLSRQWKETSCAKVSMTQKGALTLPVQASFHKIKETQHSLALWGSFGQAGTGITSTNLWGGGLLWRWRFVGLGLGFSTGAPTEAAFAYTRLNANARLGWPISFSGWNQTQVLWLGGFVQLGPTFQHKPGAELNTILSLGGGAVVDLSWWFTEHFGMRAGGELGVDYTPSVTHSGVSLWWQTRLALLVGF